MQGTIERGVYGNATVILDLQDGYKGVIYQDTCVVAWNGERVLLTAPPCAKTQTTKLRMNQASYQFNLGYVVCKRRGKWKVYTSKLVDGKLTPDAYLNDFTAHQFTISR